MTRNTCQGFFEIFANYLQNRLTIMRLRGTLVMRCGAAERHNAQRSSAGHSR